MPLIENKIAVERTIYLDFLNREASEAACIDRSERDDLLILETLLLTHCGKLSANISQMIEYTYSKHHLRKWLQHLIKSGILISTSNNPDMATFLAERQRIYSHDAGRYPMYFGPNPDVENFSIRQNNTFSMTRLLRRDILELDESQLNLTSSRIRPSDLSLFVSNIDGFKNVIMREKDAAITKSVFQPQIVASRDNPELVLGSAARVFSALYMDHYANENACVTCSGIFDTGYFSNKTSFPIYDIPTLHSVLDVLGYFKSSACRNARLSWSLAHYASKEHRHFVYLCGAFIDSATHMIAVDGPTNTSSQGTWSSIRESLASILSNDLAVARERFPPNPVDITTFLRIGSEALQKTGETLARSSASFGDQWRKYVPQRSSMKFLLMVATDTEEDEVHRALSQDSYIESGRQNLEKGFAFRYVKSNAVEIYICRSSTGSSGVSGSHLVTSDAIRNIKPSYVISTGICFGFKDKGLDIGDIAISESYEAVRQGHIDVIERGKNMPSGPKLLGAAREVMREYRRSLEKPRAKTGLYLCGSKLVDDPRFVGALSERFPDALAGEMEATGVISAAYAENVEWLVAKSVCDWGYNKDKIHQKSCAEASARFVVSMLHTFVNSD